MGVWQMTTINQTEARLNTHEEVCALRYDGICARLKRLENVGLTVAGAMIMMLLSILVKMN
jgi:hypothetical protein